MFVDRQFISIFKRTFCRFALDFLLIRTFVCCDENGANSIFGRMAADTDYTIPADEIRPPPNRPTPRADAQARADSNADPRMWAGRTLLLS